MFSLPQFALVVLFFPTVVVGDPIHIPLVRRSSGNRDIDHYSSAANLLQAKYITGQSYSPLGRRASSESIQTINLRSDSSYLASVSIGTPPQSFTFSLDTGASDLFILYTLCTSCNYALFDPSRSSSITSSHARTTISYVTGNMSGTIMQDVVSLGNFTVHNQTFLAVDKYPVGLFYSTMTGMMGLAFSAAASTRSTSFWQALGSQLAAPEMAFYLTRFNDDSSAQEEEPGGVFTLGGVDSTLFTGNIEFLAMSSGTPTYWSLNMSAITVQGRSVQITTGNPAVFVIGNSLIGGPTADVNAIWAVVPGSAPVVNYTGFYSFPCFTTVQVTLSFGGKAWPINVTDMNLGQVSPGSSQCFGAIFDVSNEYSGPPTWIVGDAFLKNVYSVFRADPPSIGFAELSKVAGGSGAPNDSSATTNDVGRFGGPGNDGTSTRITSPAMMTTAMIVVLMYLF